MKKQDNMELYSKFEAVIAGSRKVASNYFFEALRPVVRKICSDSGVICDAVLAKYKTDLIKLLKSDIITDAKVTEKFAQKLGEAHFYYSCIVQNIALEKVPETNKEQTPDFCVNISGDEFYFEVKTLSVVGGERGIDRDIDADLAMNVELERQRNLGRNLCTAGKVSEPYGENIKKWGNVYGPIHTIISKARQNISVGQFKRKNTFLVLDLSMLHALVIQPYELRPVHFFRSHAISGVFWMSAFQRPGMLVFGVPDYKTPGIERVVDCEGILAEHECIRGILLVLNPMQGFPELCGLFRHSDVNFWRETESIFENLIIPLVESRWNDDRDSNGHWLYSENKDFSVNRGNSGQ